jgi:alkylation response protein AidB-like acyl-CoA dehydrogenase
MSTLSDLGLTEDQLSLVETARDFADENLAPNAVTWDQTKHFPVDVLRKAAQLGMGGITVSEDFGGSGLSRLDSVLIFEALASGCPTIASYISIHNMVAGMIDKFGSVEQRGRYLPTMCSMEVLSSYCLTEPTAGSDAAAIQTSAARVDGGYELNGVKQFISGAGAAGVYVVLARTGGSGARGISGFIVEDGTPGLSFGAPEAKMGWNAQPTRQVILDGVRVPANSLLGQEGQGFRIAMSGLDGGRLNIGSCSVGAGQSALDRAIAYLLERQAFGAKLATMQALQFRVADMQTELQAARLLLRSAAAAVDAGNPEATTMVAMAKRFATDAGFEVANAALQLFGGYGYTVDYGIEKIVRDLRVHQILEGTNEVMRVIIARSLLTAGR